jgi:hypothetical protein
VVKSSGSIYTGFSGHAANIAYSKKVETQKIKNVPLVPFACTSMRPMFKKGNLSSENLKIGNAGSYS